MSAQARSYETTAQSACFASVLQPLAQASAFSSVSRERGIRSACCDGKRSDVSGEVGWPRGLKLAEVWAGYTLVLRSEAIFVLQTDLWLRTCTDMYPPMEAPAHAV